MQDSSLSGLLLPAIDDSVFQVFKTVNEDEDVPSGSFLLVYTLIKPLSCLTNSLLEDVLNNYYVTAESDGPLQEAEA